MTVRGAMELWKKPIKEYGSLNELNISFFGFTFPRTVHTQVLGFVKTYACNGLIKKATNANVKQILTRNDVAAKVDYCNYRVYQRE